jgi:hypothetical protein
MECMGLALDCMQFGASDLGETLNAEILRQVGVTHDLPDPNAPQKFDLECLRAASDCMQLAGEVKDPEMQCHFLSRANQLTAALLISI